MGKCKKTHTDIKSIQPSDKLLLISFLSLIVLHIIGGFWHSYYSWGFSYWSVFPTNIIIIFGVLSIVVLLTTYYLRSKITLDFTDRLQFTNKSIILKIILYSFILTLTAFILYYFRSKAHVYGDGYSILDFCSTKSPLEISGQIYLQLLSVYWHQFIFKVLSMFSFFDKENIFALANVLGGIISLWALWSISNVLFRDNYGKRNFVFITTLSSASIILFFGYIENYTWVCMAGLWSLRFMLSYVKKESGILPVIFFTFLSLSLHLISFPILLTAIYTVLLRFDKFKSKKHTSLILVLVLFGSVSIVLFAQIMENQTFVPLWAIPNNPYTLLSLEHISDILNQLFLVAPLGVVLLIIYFFNKKNKDVSFDNSGKILFLLSFLTFLSAIFIDPKLGATRDWDLLSSYGLPLTIYAGYSFSKLYFDKRFPSWLIIASSIIVLVHIVPNVYEKNHPQIAIEYLDKIIWDDPHYQADYQEAYRGLSWGVIMQKHSNKGNLSEKYYSRIANFGKLKSTPYYNLGVLYNNNNQLDSARYYLHKGLELNSLSQRFLSLLAEVEYKSKNIQLAEKYARESLIIDSNYVNGLTALAVICFSQNKYEDAFTYFRKAYDLEPNNYNCIKNMGFHFANGINADSAYYYFKKAMPLATKVQKIEIIKGLIPVVLFLNRRDEAIEYLNQLKSIAPNSEAVKKLEFELKRNN